MSTEANKDLLKGTFHRRNLPAPAISFSSEEGKALFTEALSLGYMNGYFRLAEHFGTQGHPAFCGLGSLTMALNSLLIDPGRVWQGSWRWFDESMLDCCVSFEVVKQKGITLAKLACLAHCNGADVTLKYANTITIEEFRKDLTEIATLSNSSSPTVMIVSYSRKVLNQTGIGHFSPIGAYHPTKDMVLIMDVARFKYPPHWVPVTSLFEALQVIDEETGKTRGYALLKASQRLFQNCYCDEMKYLLDAAEESPSEKDPTKIEQKLQKLLSPTTEERGDILADRDRNCVHCNSNGGR